MALPANAYLYEFLYRGQPPGAPGAPAWHVIIAVSGTDAFGQPTTSYSPAMTPDQAAAAGLALPDILAGLNATALARADALQARVDALDTPSQTEP